MLLPACFFYIKYEEWKEGRDSPPNTVVKWLALNSSISSTMSACNHTEFYPHPISLKVWVFLFFSYLCYLGIIFNCEVPLKYHSLDSFLLDPFLVNFFFFLIPYGISGICAVSYPCPHRMCIDGLITVGHFPTLKPSSDRVPHVKMYVINKCLWNTNIYWISILT